MASIVLVPGAWLGAWAWDRVTAPLRQAGHSVYPLTLPGLAERVSELTPAVGLMAHVNDVIKSCERHDLRDAVLVGHSYAGAVIGGVVRRMPGRFKAQVYLDTLPLEEGRCLLEGFSPEGKARFLHALVTWWGTRVWPVPADLGAQAPVDGLSPQDLELIKTDGTPHPAFTFEERLSGQVQPGPYPRSHAISCVESDAAGEAEKAEFLVGHPDWTYRHLPLCHWPMFSSPLELASQLDEIARG